MPSQFPTTNSIVRAEGVKTIFIMNEQEAWRVGVNSNLKDPQTWETIKNQPLQQRVTHILDLYGKMYQQPNNPFEIIGKTAGLMRNNVVSLDLKKLEKKQGNDFILSVMELVNKQVQENIKQEFEFVKQEIKK